MDFSAVEAWLFNPTVAKIIGAVVAVILARGLAMLLSSSVLGRIHDTTARYRARKMVALFSYLLAAVVITIIFSDKLGGLTVAFGVAGAGIAFALQEVIASLAGWVAVMFGGFYRIGDRVQLGGIRGDVIDIGVIRTTIMEIGEWVKGDLYTGRIVRVANSFVFKEPVFNYSGDFPFLWDEIMVPIKFGSDYAEARKILQTIAGSHLGEYAARAKTDWAAMVTKFAIEDAQIDPMVTMIANDNWVEFTLRYVVDHKRRRGTKDLLWTEVLAAVEGTNGRVGMASMTVHLVETPTFDVRMLPPRAG